MEGSAHDRGSRELAGVPWSHLGCTEHATGEILHSRVQAFRSVDWRIVHSRFAFLPGQDFKRSLYAPDPAIHQTRAGLQETGGNF